MVRGLSQTCAWVYYEYLFLQMDCDLQHMLCTEIAGYVQHYVWVLAAVYDHPSNAHSPCAPWHIHLCLFDTLFHCHYTSDNTCMYNVRYTVLICVSVMCVSGACDLLTDVTMRLFPPPPVSSAGYEEEDGGHINKALHLL